jgi:hypothetical protein
MRLSKANTRKNTPKRCTVGRRVRNHAYLCRNRVQQYHGPGSYAQVCGGIRGGGDGVCDRVYAFALLQCAVERVEAELSAG